MLNGQRQSQVRKFCVTLLVPDKNLVKGLERNANSGRAVIYYSRLENSVVVIFVLLAHTSLHNGIVEYEQGILSMTK